MADLIPPRRGEFLTRDGQPTQRFITWIENLTLQGNTTASNTSTNVSDNSTQRAQLLALQEKVGSGDFLTSDDTGFTVDSERLTVDMDES